LLRTPISLLFMLAGCAAGCATLSYDVDGAKQSWQGARYEDVVVHWGVPARHTEFNDGRHVYTWDSERTTSTGSVEPTISIFGGTGVGIGVGVGVGAGGHGGYDRVRCERTLIFTNGVVSRQTWLGPTSYCSTFRRG
jgi:hypothetical protein